MLQSRYFPTSRNKNTIAATIATKILELEQSKVLKSQIVITEDDGRGPTRKNVFDHLCTGGILSLYFVKLGDL